jgi:hypothetical protein
VPLHNLVERGLKGREGGREGGWEGGLPGWTTSQHRRKGRTTWRGVSCPVDSVAAGSGSAAGVSSLSTQDGGQKMWGAGAVGVGGGMGEVGRNQGEMVGNSGFSEDNQLA